MCHQYRGKQESILEKSHQIFSVAQQYWPWAAGLGCKRDGAGTARQLVSDVVQAESGVSPVKSVLSLCHLFPLVGSGCGEGGKENTEETLRMTGTFLEKMLEPLTVSGFRPVACTPASLSCGPSLTPLSQLLWILVWSREEGVCIRV